MAPLHALVAFMSVLDTILPWAVLGRWVDPLISMLAGNRLAAAELEALTSCGTEPGTKKTPNDRGFGLAPVVGFEPTT
jgi:hypothetical protein